MSSEDRTWLLMMLSAHLGRLDQEATRLRERVEKAIAENDPALDTDLIGVAASYEREARTCRRVIDWLERVSMLHVEDGRFAKAGEK